MNADGTGHNNHSCKKAMGLTRMSSITQPGSSVSAHVRATRGDRHNRHTGGGGLRLLRISALAVGVVCVLPHVGVVLAAIFGSFDTLAHLASTVLGRYTLATLVLVITVAAATCAIGTITAWLVVMTEFPGRWFLEFALVAPLAFPAYVLAYAYTHLLDHPGIVQVSLRALTGWGARDYWFPEIRSLGGAITMLTLVLYPYVYLLARAAFLAQNGRCFIAARALGRGHPGAFIAVAAPMARPAIAAGTLVVAMETIADFGTVSYFSVQTFATGIYSSWFSLADRAAAAQLSLGLLAFAITLVCLERANRGFAGFYNARGGERMPRIPLIGRTRWYAFMCCLMPVLLGAAIPVITLAAMAFGSGQHVFSSRYMTLLTNSLGLGAIAATITVAAAVLVGARDRLIPGWQSKAIFYATRLGYAVPGGVIAVGLLAPFAAFDNVVDAAMRGTFGISTGLMITGSAALLVCAYMIRFIAAAQGSLEGGIMTMGGNLDAASRVLGAGVWGTLWRVHLPVLGPSLLTAAIIVFVDVLKELPATLILRPFNLDTLAVQAHRLAADERLEGAAVPSLIIAAAGILPVIVLCRGFTRHQGRQPRR